MSAERYFTKENLDNSLRELAKEYRKRNKKGIPAEIILIGGASILLNYGFREMTYDMDAVIRSSDAMKESINTVGDKLGLPNGWLNTDFKKTRSYTPKIETYSKYYKTFSNILQVRTVTAEYLVAMKLMAGRQYKNDLSDVVGIMIEQEKRGDVLTPERIRHAIEDLYDEYERIPQNSRSFLEAMDKEKNLDDVYRRCRELEMGNNDILTVFQNAYPGVLNENNLADVLRMAKARKQEKESLQK